MIAETGKYLVKKSQSEQQNCTPIGVQFLNYIFSGAEKPSREIQVSNTFFARPINAI